MIIRKTFIFEIDKMPIRFPSNIQFICQSNQNEVKHTIFWLILLFQKANSTYASI